MCLPATEGDQAIACPFAARLDAASGPRPLASSKEPQAGRGTDSTPPPAVLGDSPRSPVDPEALSAALSRSVPVPDSLSCHRFAIRASVAARTQHSPS